jgi:hypothetical protein
MEKLLLKLISLLDPLFRKQGVNVEQLHTIVRVKLTMDNRRVYMNWKQKQQKESSNRLWAAFLVYGLTSIFFGVIILVVPNILFSMVSFHAYLIVILSMILITDFSTVLLDTTDNVVILPRPVNSRTLFMARLVHIVIYLLQFYIALALIPGICTFIAYGWVVGLMFIVTSLCSVLLAVSLTYFMYLLFLTYSSEEKLKDMITYVQIAMGIIFMVGYQVVPRMIDFSNVMADIQFRWVFYLIPFFWMGYTLQAFHEWNFDLMHVVMILLTVLIPFILYWLLNKYLAASFAHKLAAINTDGAKTKTSDERLSRRNLSDFFSSIVCRTQTERSGFRLLWKLSGREKYFRLQFYPSLAYMLVMAFLFFFRKDQRFDAMMERLPNTKSFLGFIYLPILSLATSLGLMGFSENFMASWIYQSTPLKKPGEIITGAMKALFIKYFMPIFIILFSFCFYIWGTAVLDDFLLGMANLLLCFVVIKLLSKHYLPFTRQPNSLESGGRFMLLLLQSLVIILMVAIHYLLLWLNYSYLIYAIAAFSFSASWFGFDKLQKLSWRNISI